MFGRGQEKVSLKSREQLDEMRKAGRLVAELRMELVDSVRPGMSTADLDGIAESFLRKRRVRSCFKGYQGFPGYICTSVNEQVVHGIPCMDVVLGDGDIVSIDMGIEYHGWMGDSAVTVPVGKPSREVLRLLQVTEASLWEGILQARPGRRLNDIGHAVESYARRHHLGVVEGYAGHGIGRELHEPPSVPNYGEAGTGMKLLPGMVIAIEPMLNLGTHKTKVLDDGWTVVTEDGRLSAHFEHTVAITPEGPEILTKL